MSEEKNDITIKGTIRASWRDTAREGKQFLGAAIECSNGTRWVIDYSEDSSFHALDGREVIVSGVPYEPRHGQFLAGRALGHFRVSSIQLASVVLHTQLVELGQKTEFSGRFRRTTDQSADFSISFVAQNGETYVVSDYYDPAKIGAGVTRIRAYPVRPLPLHAEAIARLWITDILY